MLEIAEVASLQAELQLWVSYKQRPLKAKIPALAASRARDWVAQACAICAVLSERDKLSATFVNCARVEFGAVAQALSAEFAYSWQVPTVTIARSSAP